MRHNIMTFFFGVEVLLAFPSFIRKWIDVSLAVAYTIDSINNN